MALIVVNDVTDHTAEQWRSYGDGVEVLIRSLDAREYQIARARAARQIQKLDGLFRSGDVGVAPGEISEHDYQCTLLGKYIVRDWRGAVDAQGQPAAFSEQSAIATLRSDVNFFLFVLKEAGEIAAAAEQERSEHVGKSLPATDGKPSESA
ncbi:MAG: hypothetical protein KER_03088 [Kerstersia gyiorum]|uniref:hypothetical protein n=1 Tax=Kerstersia gyiorum TaxID=206506 RepID=UPI0030D39369